jgi:hypothetical protein
MKSYEKVARNNRYLENVRAKSTCALCGSKDGLLFHHVDGSRFKRKDVSILANCGCSLQRLMEEVHRCETVCKSCHAKVHRGKRRWVKA